MVGGKRWCCSKANRPGQMKKARLLKATGPASAEMLRLFLAQGFGRSWLSGDQPHNEIIYRINQKRRYFNALWAIIWPVSHFEHRSKFGALSVHRPSNQCLAVLPDAVRLPLL